MYSPRKGPADYFIYDRSGKAIRANRVTKDMEGIYTISIEKDNDKALEYFQLRVKESQLFKLLKILFIIVFRNFL